MAFYNEYLEKARELANQVYDQGVMALSKTETERRLAEALSHANWGASTTLMSEIAHATNDSQEFPVIMREIWAACASTGRNWRVCYKGLALLEFLLKNGSKRVIQEAKENRSKLRRLETFSYMRDGVEKGSGVREKAKVVVELLDDDEYLKRERGEAAKLRAKFTGVGRDGTVSGIGGYSGGGGYQSDEDAKRFASSDSDDESSKKKKSSKSKKKSDNDDEGSDYEKSSKSKSKKKYASDEEEDFPSSKSKKSSKKKAAADDDDFEPDFSTPTEPTKASASKKKADDDSDFGFSDDDSKAKKAPSASKTKLGPIGNISVKIPGVASSSTSAPSAAGKAKKANDDEVDLLGGFDPFGTSSSAPSTKPTAAPVAAPAAPQQPSTADILNLFNAPPQAQAQAFGVFPAASGVPSQPQQQPAFPVLQQPQATFPGLQNPAGHGGHPGMMFPQSVATPSGVPMMGQFQQQPMKMGGGMMMPPQSGMSMMMPQPGMMPQQPMMMSMPMGGAPAPRPVAPAQQQQQQAKKDAFSGLLDFSAGSKPAAPPANKQPPPSLI